MKLRNLLFCVALSVSAMALADTSASADWRRQVDGLMKQGEFAKASTLMQKLPKKMRQENAVTIDSLNQIMQRIRTDFTLTPEEGVKAIRAKMPEATDEQIANWKKTRALEVMNIDGKEWWFRKAVRNLWLLGEEFAQQNAEENLESCGVRMKYLQEAMECPADRNNVRDWRRANITFTLDVKPDVIPAGETLRVWMPFPYENLRQKNIKMESANRAYKISENSLHHTVYMEAVAEQGKPTHFEYTFSYDVAERHIAKQDLLAQVRPYIINEEYKKYTSTEYPHVVITDSLREFTENIVGGCDVNPVIAANTIYHWITSRFPWAGAREYSTIPNIPEYVLLNKHGDCGQVALLYIAMCRSIGIPARWESGYMLHPGEVNYHDWGETYFEGIGWVPVDVSFGRTCEYFEPMRDYYCSGIDVYRLATNEAVGMPLDPVKTFIRSETVDFQPGEVEWKGGNLYYENWNSHIKVNGITRLNPEVANADEATKVLADLKKRIAPDKRVAVWDVNAINQNGTLAIFGTVGYQEQKDAVSKELCDKGFTNVENNLVVLHNAVPAEKRWGLVKLAVASLRNKGAHSAEMDTQGIMGMPVRVLDVTDDWYRVQTPDQYISYIPNSSIVCFDEAKLKAWQKAKRYIVTCYASRLVTEAAGDETVTDLVMGNILEFVAQKGDWTQLQTPDGRQGWVPTADVADLEQWAKQDFDAAQIEKTARRMLGSGYLWGGTSTKITDCSGLAKVSYFSNGIILARDASQQALTGQKIKGEDWAQCRLGDLLFFGNSATGRVTHVGIYLRDGLYIHCSGQVKINSLDPAHPDYLYSPLSASRIDGQVGTPFITYVRNHPWYF